MRVEFTFPDKKKPNLGFFIDVAGYPPTVGQTVLFKSGSGIEKYVVESVCAVLREHIVKPDMKSDSSIEENEKKFALEYGNAFYDYNKKVFYCTEYIFEVNCKAV